MPGLLDQGLFAHPYTYLSAGAFAVTLGSILYIHAHTDSAPSRWLTAQFGAGAAWIALNVVHFGAANESVMLFGQFAKSTSIWVMTVCWVGFTFSYTDRSDRLTRVRWAVVLAPPAVFLSLTWVDPLVHVLWSGHRVVESGPVTVLKGTETPVRVVEYGVQTAYAVLGATVLYRGVGPRRIHRRQVSFLVAGTVLVVAGAWFTVSDQYPYSAVSIAPVFVGFSTPLLVYAFLEHELFELAPVARDRVFTILDSPVVVVDDRYRVVDWNPEASRVIGIEETDAGDQLETVFPEYVAQVGLPGDDGDGIELPTDGGTRADLTLSVDGEERTYEVGVAPVFARGRTAGLVVRCTDVTHQVDRAERLQRQNERLDRFATVVSHDLRNPMAVAEGYARELADDPELSGDSRVREVNVALEEMNGLVDGILTMARGGDVDETEVIDLSTAVDRAWEAAAELSDGRASLENELPTYTVEADPDQVRRALENLFRNAVEHGTDDDGVTVRVFETDEGVAFADDGPGIDPAVRDTLFEYGSSSDSESTGIGLAAVQTIVEGHGWAVTAGESESGGARFDLSIPGDGGTQ